MWEFDKRTNGTVVFGLVWVGNSIGLCFGPWVLRYEYPGKAVK